MSLLNKKKVVGKMSSNRKKMLLAGGFDFDKVLDDKVVSANELIETKSGSKHEAADFLKKEVPGYHFAHLPGSEREVEEISKIYLGTTKLNNIEEEEFGKLCEKYSKIHIATHGYTLHLQEPRSNYMLEDSITMDRSLLASGLVMTGANKAHQISERADGLISAREMCEYDLNGVDFFVLSACRTADGEVSDEGPAGLVRGLKRAGVKTILAALWEVNDDAAMIYMKRFYELLLKGMSPSQAYADAKRYLREYAVEYPETEEEYNPATMTTEYIETGRMVKEYPYSSPSIWAPFVLIDGI